METDTDSPAFRPGGEGERLWAWLHEPEFGGTDACRPMCEEICRIADRLQEVRSKLATQGLSVSAPRGRQAKNPLLDIEIKLSGQFSKLWKTLGLADKPPAEPRPIGRPPGSGVYP